MISFFTQLNCLKFIVSKTFRNFVTVIFIKAPTYRQKTAVIPVYAQNEEKTIVYVLSKKPEIQQDIEFPEPPVTEPSKPEVFFIKYKHEQEAQQAQQSIQGDFFV